MKSYMYKAIITIFLMFLASFVIIIGVIFIEGNKTENEEVDYLIVLGARLYGETPSPALLERLKVASKYLKNNKDLKVIVSGGQGSDEDVSEAFAMSKYLVDEGIEKDRIIIEDISTSTFENLSFSLDKIKEKDSSDNIKVLIATNEFHIFRSKLLAKKLGMVPYGLPAKTPKTIVVTSYIREYFAVIESFLHDKTLE